MTYKGKLKKKNHVNMSKISKTRDLFADRIQISGGTEHYF